MTYTTPRSIDTDAHPLFTTYSAGNFAEVAPERISPLSWSAIGPPVERGMRRIFNRLWPTANVISGSHYLTVGYFACKPYHNLSTLCACANYVFGLRPADVARAYFQGAVAPTGTKTSAHLSARSLAVPRMIREFVHIRQAARQVAETMVLLENEVSSMESQRSIPALARLFPQIKDVVYQSWEVHYSTTLMLVPLKTLLDKLGNRCLDYWADLEPLVNRPNELVWDSIGDLSGNQFLSASTDFLGHSFYEIMDDREPWSEYNTRTNVLSRSDWTYQGMNKSKLWNTVPKFRSVVMRSMTGVVQDCMEQREYTKTLAMRALHLLRRLCPTIGEIRAVHPENLPYLCIDELMDDVGTSGQLHERAERRKKECEKSLSREMPDLLVTDRPQSDGTSGAGRNSAAGHGVYPGRIEGNVVFGTAKLYEASRPRILVCDSADADVAPLIPHVDGVVTARGSALSHLAILLRERETISVLGHPLANSLRQGQRVSVDGNSGEVRPIGE